MFFQLLRGIAAEIRKGGVQLSLFSDGACGGGIHPGKNIGKVDAFHIYAVIGHGYFIAAHGFEGSGACAQRADIEAGKTAYRAAHAAEYAKILGKGGVKRRYGGFLSEGVVYAELAQHIAHGYLAAQSVAAVGKIHMGKLVGIGLHKHGHIGVFKSLGGTVFIAEIGQTHDDALTFSCDFSQENRHRACPRLWFRRRRSG